MPSPSVPLDCISLILIHVDHAGDLFNCLTLCRAVSPQVARMLYTDPLQHFPSLSLRGKRLLLSRLLELSPTNDKDTNRLRAILGITQAPFRADTIGTQNNDWAASQNDATVKVSAEPFSPSSYSFPSSTSPPSSSSSPLPPLPSPPTPSSPMLDYLSFVRIVRWRDINHADPFLQFFPSTWTQLTDVHPTSRDVPHLSRVRNTLTRAICEHHLEHIVELELEASALEWAIEHAPLMDSLESITINRAYSRTQVTYDYETAIRLVVAIQEYHSGSLRGSSSSGKGRRGDGNDGSGGRGGGGNGGDGGGADSHSQNREVCRLRRCEFTASPLLDMMASPEKMLAIVTAAVELDQLLATSGLPEVDPKYSSRRGKAIQQASECGGPDDGGPGGTGGAGGGRVTGGMVGEFRGVRTSCVLDGLLARMKTIGIQEHTPLWRFLIQHYGSTTEVLRRCRQVRVITGHLRTKHANIFQWAVEEAQQRAQEQAAYSSSSSATCGDSNGDDESGVSTTVSRWQQRHHHGRVIDLVPVETIDMHLLDWSADDPTTILHDMMRGFGSTLEKFWVQMRAPHDAEPATISLEAPDWAPTRLQNLAIRHDGPFRWAPHCLEQPHIRLTSLVVMLQTTNVLYNRGKTPLWPVLHLPHLKNLSLGARAINAFEPSSLYHMRALEVLDLHAMAEDRLSFRTARPWRDTWTWDWPLPRLRRLYIYAISRVGDMSFNFRMLRTCPSLDQLELYFEGAPFRLHARSQLPEAERDFFRSIETFCLRGPWYLGHPDALRLLLTCMPRLDTFDVSVPIAGTQRIQPILDATRDHPSLNVVEIPNEINEEGEAEADGLDNLDFEAFGLVPVDPDDVEYDSELSKCQYLIGSGCYRLDRSIE